MYSAIQRLVSAFMLSLCKSNITTMNTIAWACLACWERWLMKYRKASDDINFHHVSSHSRSKNNFDSVQITELQTLQSWQEGKKSDLSQEKAYDQGKGERCERSEDRAQITQLTPETMWQTYRPFPQSISVRTNNSARMRLGWTFSYMQAVNSNRLVSN